MLSFALNVFRCNKRWKQNSLIFMSRGAESMLVTFPGLKTGGWDNFFSSGGTRLKFSGNIRPKVLKKFWKTISTNVVFWPWVQKFLQKFSQKIQKISHFGLNIGRLWVKNWPIFSQKSFIPNLLPKKFWGSGDLFWPF